MKASERRSIMRGRGYYNPSMRQRLIDIGPVVYAVRVDGGLIKIGYTGNLYDRIRKLHASSCDILAWRSGTLEDEMQIHRSLDGLAARGAEYYPPTGEVVSVVNAMRSDLGLPPIAG